MIRVRSYIIAILGPKAGASLVECALLIALVAVVCLAGITALGTEVHDKFCDVVRAISSLPLATYGGPGERGNPRYTNVCEIPDEVPKGD